MTVSFPPVNGPPSRLRVIVVTPLAGTKTVKRLILMILTSLFCAIPASAEIRLDVDLSERKLVAVHDGKEASFTGERRRWFI